MVGQRVAQDGDADFVAQMPHDGRLRMVQNHAGFMQQAPHHINGMFGAVEFFIGGNHPAVGIGDFYVLPGIDVNFLNIGGKKVGGQKRKLCHFTVEPFHKLIRRQALHTQAVIGQVLGDVGGDLLFLLRRIARNHGGILAGDVFLHLL